MKNKLFLAPLAAMVLSTSVLASESGSSGTANQAVVDAFSTAGQDMVATGSALIPVALTVVTLGLVVMFGYKLFKKLTGR